MKETLQEFSIGLSHLPAFLRRQRLADGHGRLLDVDETNAALADARASFGIPENWIAGEMVPTVSDVAIVQVGRKGHPFAAYLKIARSDGAEVGLTTQAETLAGLRNDRRLDRWSHLLPKQLAVGVTEGHSYVIEEALPGVPLAELLYTPFWKPSLNDAVSKISELHALDGELCLVDESLFSELVEPALHMVADLPTSSLVTTRLDQVERLRRWFRRELLGRQVWMSRVHGDFSPNNVLADARSGRVTGILDWDRSTPHEPSFLDIGQLALSAHSASSGEALGPSVRSIITGKTTLNPELALLNDFWDTHEGDNVSLPVVALLTLLRHMQSNIDKAPRYAQHKLWVFRTLQTVLNRLPE